MIQFDFHLYTHLLGISTCGPHLWFYRYRFPEKGYMQEHLFLSRQPTSHNWALPAGCPCYGVGREAIAAIPARKIARRHGCVNLGEARPEALAWARAARPRTRRPATMPAADDGAISCAARSVVRTPRDGWTDGGEPACEASCAVPRPFIHSSSHPLVHAHIATLPWAALTHTSHRRCLAGGNA